MSSASSQGDEDEDEDEDDMFGASCRAILNLKIPPSCAKLEATLNGRKGCDQEGYAEAQIGPPRRSQGFEKE